MTSSWTLIAVSLALIVAFFPGDSAADKISDIATECEDAKCEDPGSKYCFGFLTKGAKTENVGRDQLSAAVTDGCFKMPSETNCEGKPWVAVKRDGDKFAFELISKEPVVGMILFKENADPATNGNLGILCEKDKTAKYWTSDLFGSGGTEVEGSASDGTLCTFKLDLTTGDVQLEKENFAVAFFQGASKPADASEITSTKDELDFWGQLKKAGDGDSGKPGGGSADGGAGRSAAGGGAILVAVSSIAMIVWSG